MNVSRCRHAQPTLQRGAEVGDNVTEHIVGHDDLKHFRRADHLHRERINEHVEVFDSRKLFGHLFERPHPEVAAEAHDVALIRHADRFSPAPLRELECVPDDPFDAFPRGDILLHGDLFRRPFLEITAHSDVRPFGVFPEDHKVNMLTSLVFQR